MNFISLEPFIPSGNNYEKAKLFFQELGFEQEWEEEGLAGFRQGNCSFILQQYDNKAFAENLMLSVKIDDVNAFWERVNKKDLPGKFGVPVIGRPVQQPYGKEVNIIDPAGVCWHFIEADAE
ncbi:VOC family protein [Niabella hibiscisoli]|uniref:hypothetical protein n=1 Tax=Niabella hibiscisoli TaxID=1825928 RepID=UPI001F10B75B|nr:hypothetical protein [Niabella hibiscisoli]MCH5719767.1 hypothetical protein [Niabella hibiscisoli]